jgi:hypothetical protein
MEGGDAKLYQEERVGQEAQVLHHGVDGGKSVLAHIKVYCAGDGFECSRYHLVGNGGRAGVQEYQSVDSVCTSESAQIGVV